MSASSQSENTLTIGQSPQFTLHAVGDVVVLNRLQDALAEGSLLFQFECVQSKLIEPAAVTFKRLAVQWRHKIRYSSSLKRNIMQPEYWDIIKMDKAALPFIFQEMKLARWADWLFALRVITGQSFGTPESELSEIRNAWLKWGRENGYLAA